MFGQPMQCDMQCNTVVIETKEVDFEYARI